ncbi:zinc ribbon domain-containing protein [Metarhizobium album]|uniref:Zinc ribbon domain-containing protein n=1 Tax=Metarhizobium album TaxID=2182425 RepID=A0A2U2DFM4_9HYPH|nr:zinc ribbon domain-containing protein [Rhizobium album]
MTERKRFQCLNCGHRFETEVLTPEERREAKREDRPVYGIACPKCHRTDIRSGWG